jgi:predicted thioesterase
LAAALDEAMALLLHGQGTFALTGRLVVELHAPAPIGAFVEVEADVDRVEGRRLRLSAAARDPEDAEKAFATAKGTFIERERGGR